MKPNALHTNLHYAIRNDFKPFVNLIIREYNLLNNHIPGAFFESIVYQQNNIDMFRLIINTMDLELNTPLLNNLLVMLCKPISTSYDDEINVNDISMYAQAILDVPGFIPPTKILGDCINKSCSNFWLLTNENLLLTILLQYCLNNHIDINLKTLPPIWYFRDHKFSNILRYAVYNKLTSLMPVLIEYIKQTNGYDDTTIFSSLQYAERLLEKETTQQGAEDLKSIIGMINTGLLNKFKKFKAQMGILFRGGRKTKKVTRKNKNKHKQN